MIGSDFPVLGCNMRIGADVDFKMMKDAGFRMLLYGIESANQSTLDRIKKGVNADDYVKTIKAASQAGLEPHIAVMLGFPWESKDEERKTVDLVTYLLRKGYARTAQASVYDVPGQPSYPYHNTSCIFHSVRYPEFWYHQVRRISSWADFQYFAKAIRKGIVRD